MPELPEVETVARNLRPDLTGRMVISAELLNRRTLATPSPDLFMQQVAGQQILGVSRRAKYVDIQLSAFHLFVHLRMSGDLVVKDAQALAEPHDRLILFLSDEKKLAFNDTRKFGRVWLTAHPEDVIGGLGPEPFDPAFTSQILYQKLQSKNRQIKPLLLDQSFLAGLGNIYTDESLHLSHIHPLRQSNTITIDEAERLFLAIRAVLQAGIDHNGASIDWVYRGGGFQNYFRAYGRTGEPCPACGTPIERTVVGQRGTHFCPNCQKMR